MAVQRPRETTSPDDVPTWVFRSAVGWPACGQILICSLMGAAMILLLTTSSRHGVIATAVLILAVAMPVWLVAGTTYRIRNGTLTVSKLIRRERIDLADITAVKPWPRWSHPIEYGEDFALSSKRMLIGCGESRIFVSPRDEANFLAALGRQNDA
ncbi:MAG: hypothetical protein F4029_20360 [Gammaproteobacteria bacterium]|nr:hypothetical protein [Gammaproteobacteria bacterium]MYF28966.1 hypothetical protein [Gammaproteobacteria bacterium]MYK48568.1 hypothetical protein [Gammaproteobacteria bacterium]